MKGQIKLCSRSVYKGGSRTWTGCSRNSWFSSVWSLSRRVQPLNYVTLRSNRIFNWRAVSDIATTSSLNDNEQGSLQPMTDNFINLVSQANPATRQYQPTQNGYPPSASSPYAHNNSPQILDPFFDDEDEMPDSAFGMSRSTTAPMQSQESGLPLREGAVPPAGSGPSKDWTFDDEEVQLPTGAGRPFNGSSAFPGVEIQTEKGPKKKPRRKWRWPWQKETELVGERIIALNNSPMNAEYCSNFVSTSKYNMVSFVPKFLGGESGSLNHDLWLILHRINRTILEIREFVLLIHGLYSTNTGRITY